MMRLKSKLLSLNANKTDKVKVFSPRNCEELRIPFKADKTAKVVGKLASIPPPTKLPPADGSLDGPQQQQQQQLITGVLVQNDFKLSLMAPEDLREYAGLTTTTIVCRQRIRLSAAGVDLIKWALESTFGAIDELPEMRKLARQKQGPGDVEGAGDDEKQDSEEAKAEPDADGDTNMDAADADEEVERPVAGYLVMGCVSVRCFASGEMELEWEGNMLNDGFADAVMAVLLTVESSPAAVKRKLNIYLHARHGKAANDFTATRLK